MKQNLRISIFLISFSFLAQGQIFNRSLTDFGLGVQDMVAFNGNTYLLGGASGVIKLDGSGTEVMRRKFINNNFIHLSFSLIKESDSTLIASGIALDSSRYSNSEYFFISRLDTALNILNFKVVLDSADFYYHKGTIGFFQNGNILLRRSNGIYALDHSFNILANQKNIDTPSFNIKAIPLNNDSVLVQRDKKTQDAFVLVDLTDSTEYDKTSNFNINFNGSFELYDLNDSIFYFLNNRGTSSPVKLQFYRKDDLSFVHSFNIDSAAGFPVFEARNHKDGIIGISRYGGKFVVLSGQFPFNVYTDSLSSNYISEVGTPISEFRNGTMAFVSRIKSCQTHVESFTLSQRANTFGEIGTNASINNAMILGHANPILPSSGEYLYKIAATVDVWIKNESGNFLDSLTLNRTFNSPEFSCDNRSKLQYDAINLNPSDSVMVTTTDTIWVYTTDTNVAIFKLGVIPVAANGNIVYPSEIDTVGQVFIGMGLREKRMATEFTLYPSPANNVVNLENPEGGPIEEVSIYSFSGQMLKSLVSTENKVEVNVSGLNAGLYVIKCKIADEWQTQLFLKQ